MQYFCMKKVQQINKKIPVLLEIFKVVKKKVKEVQYKYNIKKAGNINKSCKTSKAGR